MAATHEQAIPRKLAKRLAGECQHCKEPAIEGSDFCAVHDAHEKGQRRARQSRYRLRLAEVGLCIVAGCGAKVGKRMRPDGRPVLRRCRACTKAKRAEDRARRARRGVTSAQCGVTSTEAPAPVKLEIGKDGATRTRYVPRAGQGGPSKEEIARGHLRLLADARRLDAVFEANYPAVLPELDAMPRIQRAEGKAQLASSLVRSARLRLQVAEEVDPALKGTCAGCGRAHAEDAV